MNQFFVLKKSEFEEIKSQFMCENDPSVGKGYSLEFSRENFNLLPPGENLFKLAAKAKIKEMLE